jgi:hypothetical protein
MTKLLHIYAFGSICRGEILPGSDVDLLAIRSGGSNDLSRSMFSIYSHAKVRTIWREGNPFAWHLHAESRLIYSSDGADFISTLGSPATYETAGEDCTRFLRMYMQASLSLQHDRASAIFDLSTAFLGIRNFSTCYLLGRGHSDFSRGVALKLIGDMPPSDLSAYRVLERARLLCTRGHGDIPTRIEIDQAIRALPNFEEKLIGIIEGTG